MATILHDPGNFGAQIAALLAAVPEDRLAAFALADCLEEQDDAGRRFQGELLRLVYTLTRSPEVAGRTQLEDRMQALLAQGTSPFGPRRRVMLDDEVALDFVWVPPGAFLMGSPDDEEG